MQDLDAMSLLSVNSVVTSYGDVMYTTCQSMRNVVAKSSCFSACSRAFLVAANLLFLVRYLHLSYLLKLRRMIGLRVKSHAHVILFSVISNVTNVVLRYVTKSTHDALFATCPQHICLSL